MRLGLELGPSGLGRHPEDVLRDVLVPVLWVGALHPTSASTSAWAFLKGVGDVLEEDEAKDDVLVLGGIHAAPQGIGHAPIVGLVACILGFIVRGSNLVSASSRCHSSSSHTKEYAYGQSQSIRKAGLRFS